MINVFSQKEKTTTYTIKQGEGLYRVAKNNNTTIDILKKYNPGLDENNIKVGQVIKVPATAQSKPTATPAAQPTKPTQATAKTKNHSVEKGETLFAIARKYNTSVAELESINGIKRDDGLKLGQIIKVPVVNKTTTLVVEEKKTSTYTPEINEEPSAAFLDYKKSDAQLVHTVQSGETAAQIASFYNLKEREVYLLNSMPYGTKLTPGLQLTVGSLKTNKTTKLPENNSPTTEIVVENTTETYTKPSTAATQEVRKETVEKTTIANNEKNNTANHENKTTVRAENVTPAVSSIAESTPAEYAHVIKHYEDEGFSRKTLRGIATFIPAGTMANTNSAYYNFAEIGSVIKVTNLMSKKTVYVKVIGKLPPEEAHTEVILKLTREMADELKVNEDKYLVEVTSFSK